MTRLTHPWALIAPALLLAGGALALDLDDRHLPVIPRTEAEAAHVAAVTAPPTEFSAPEVSEAMSAGDATVRAVPTDDAFSQVSGGMTGDGLAEFQRGRRVFDKLWVAAPAMTKASDGLGPFYNARSCQACHIRDGRGHLPEAGAAPVSIVLRLSVPGGTAHAGIPGDLPTLPDPVYGSQLQGFAAPGLTAEGRMATVWSEAAVTLSDGLVIHLRRPAYRIADPAMGEPSPGLMLSPRLAPPMIGLGLLEAVPAADILARADETDADGDGVSGRANIVRSAEFDAPMLARFGLKAGTATIRDQAAEAFARDMGLSTVLHPDPHGDCTAAQADCRAAAAGQEPYVRDGLEVDRAALDLVVFYARNLGVPERRDVGDGTVLDGKRVFHALGCAACHAPAMVTNRLRGRPEQSFQLIRPYTDLLLHDMGEGLADHRPEGRATGTEWRTAPLWGIGLARQVSGRTEFLHDGRARSLLEAVLWHGGEAQAARDGVVALQPGDRAALIAFLGSL